MLTTPERTRMDEGITILTPEEAAKRKGVNVMTVYRAIKRAELPAKNLLGRYALNPADVDAWTPNTHGGWRGGRRPRKNREE